MLPQRSKGVQKKIKFIGIKFHYICDFGNRYIRICLFPNTLIAQLRIQPPATDSVARYWMGAYTYQAVEIPHHGPLRIYPLIAEEVQDARRIAEITGCTSQLC
jgi:hypothetical protein